MGLFYYLNSSQIRVRVNNYTPEQRSCWGVYWFHSVRLSVCLSVRPSVRLSRLPCPLCNIYSSGWILSILATNDHYHERVCPTQWPLTLTYIFKVIRPWLRKSCPFCSVYSSGWIIIIFGTNDHYHYGVCCVLRFFRSWKCELLTNFWNFSALTLKKKHFSMDSFHIWYKWSLVWEGVLHIMTFDLDLYLQGHLALGLKIVSAL